MLSIPKPHAPWNFVPTLTDMIADAIITGDTETDWATFEAMFGQGFTPPTPLIGQMYASLSTNMDLFYNVPIIPDSLKDKPQYRHITSKMSGLARWLSNTFAKAGIEIEPGMIDHLVQSITRSAGRFVIDTLEKTGATQELGIQEVGLRVPTQRWGPLSTFNESGRTVFGGIAVRKLAEQYARLKKEVANDPDMLAARAKKKDPTLEHDIGRYLASRLAMEMVTTLHYASLFPPGNTDEERLRNRQRIINAAQRIADMATSSDIDTVAEMAKRYVDFIELGVMSEMIYKNLGYSPGVSAEDSITQQVRRAAEAEKQKREVEMAKRQTEERLRQEFEERRAVERQWQFAFPKGRW
jgi:hypothetical protein